MLFLLLLFVNLIPSDGLLYEAKECKKSREGCEYMGTASVTVGGITCQRWDSQTPHSHTISELNLPDRDYELSSNNCRNPDSESQGPWCYTTDPEVRWDYCNVTECDLFAECGAECKPTATCTSTSAGTEYVGTRGLTVSGRPCQRWDRQTPHQHAYTDADFPDANITDAENFCRNPNGDLNATWCYTMDNTTEWEYCDVPACADCRQSADGRGFAGSIATTVSGLTCQRWDSQEPHPHEFTDSNYFPDVSLDESANYCRNPDGREGGVWCYTTNPDVEWEFCDVPTCTEDCGKDDISKRNIKHVLQIGIDGLHHDCWLDAPGGTPNFLRLMADGASTLSKARTDMYTFSAPGWSCQLCGMDIEHTGCIDNGWEAVWMGYPNDVTPTTGTEYPFPCVFMYLKGIDANIRTASFMNWPWIYWLSGRGIPGSSDLDVTCEGLGLTNYNCDAFLTNQTADYMREVVQSSDSSYTFLHLDGADWTGHTFTWCNAQYLDYVATLDGLLGQLLDAVEGEDVLVLLSSDHGGHQFSHGAALDSDLFIPMFLKGPGVKSGHDLQQEVRNMDMVHTLVWAMGYKQSPHWNGNIMYDAFE